MEKVSKESVNYRPGDPPVYQPGMAGRRCGNCVMFHPGAKISPVGTCDLVEGRIRVVDTCDRWEAKPAAKSAETPRLEATPDMLGPEGLWHTPDRHVDKPQKLPNYIEHIAHALMRNGMDESEAIATAINAVKRWARGDLGERRGHVHPEVRAASQRALDEWERLRQSHAG